MFFSGKKEIDVVEYTCSSTRKKHARLQKETNSVVGNKLEFSATKLSIALARTILSSDPSNLDLRFQILSSFFNMQSMVDTKSRNLRLNENITRKFRDFSLTGRIGELAQALNYLFTQELLKYPIVVDYEGFISNQNTPSLPEYIGEVPDFVAVKNNENKITLVESKGSCPKKQDSKLKTVLREALEQCDNGKDYLETNLFYNVQNTYASGIWFSMSSNSWNTTLHFSDPNYDSNYRLKDFIELIRYHYCSWFALFGYYKQVFELLGNENISLEKPEKSIFIGDDEYYIFDRDNNYYPYNTMTYNYYLENRFIAFGISYKVWEALKDPGTIQNIEEYYNEPISNEEMELFADGTVLLFDYK